MEDFGFVVIAVALVAAAIAAVAFAGSGGIYRDVGRGGMSLDEPELRPSPMPGSPAYAAEEREELRQLVEAKSARRVARGEAPLDIDEEIARLTAPVAATDPALVEEVRQMVVASNERRARRGDAPLDVEAETERRLTDLGA